MLGHAVDLVHPVKVHAECCDLGRRAGQHVHLGEIVADPRGQAGQQLRRPAQVGRGQLQPPPDVPGHVRAEVLRVLLEHRAKRGRVTQRPPSAEPLVRPGQVGCRVDHLTAQAGQHLAGGAEHGPDILVDRQAEVRAPAHPQAAHVVGKQFLNILRSGHRRRRRVQGQRDAGVGPADHCQQQRDVGDRAAHRALDSHPVGHVRDRPRRYPAGRRAQADDVAEAGRVAQRAAQVAAVGQRDHPGREGGGGPAAAAARAAAGVVGIPGRAEHLVHGVRAGPEFRRVGLAQADRPGACHPAHDQRVEVGDVPGEQRRPERCPHPGRFDQVLVRDRQPVQQAGRLAGRERLVGRRRLVRRLLEGPGHDRVDDRVPLLDAGDVSRDHLARGDLLAAQQRGQRDRVLLAQVVLARGGDPPEPPVVLARGDDPPEPPVVLARGDGPPEPPGIAGLGHRCSLPAGDRSRSGQAALGRPPGQLMAGGEL